MIIVFCNNHYFAVQSLLCFTMIISLLTYCYITSVGGYCFQIILTDTDTTTSNNCIERLNLRFFTISLLRHELSPTHTLKWPERSRVQITCNTLNSYHKQHAVCRLVWDRYCLTTLWWNLCPKISDLLLNCASGDVLAGVPRCCCCWLVA